VIDILRDAVCKHTTDGDYQYRHISGYQQVLYQDSYRVKSDIRDESASSIRLISSLAEQILRFISGLHG